MAKKRILTTGFSMHTADKFACIPKKLIFDCPMQELRADGLHWLLLIYLSAKAGMQDSRATLNTKTDLARLLSPSHPLKPDGNTIKNAISTLEDLEKMGLLHISVESEGRLFIHFAHSVIRKHKQAWLKVDIKKAEILRSNAALQLWMLLEGQPVKSGESGRRIKRGIEGWYVSTLGKKLGLSFSHDSRRVIKWVRKRIKLINKLPFTRGCSEYEHYAYGRPYKIDIMSNDRTVQLSSIGKLLT